MRDVTGHVSLSKMERMTQNFWAVRRKALSAFFYRVILRALFTAQGTLRCLDNRRENWYLRGSAANATNLQPRNCKHNQPTFWTSVSVRSTRMEHQWIYPDLGNGISQKNIYYWVKTCIILGRHWSFISRC